MLDFLWNDVLPAFLLVLIAGMIYKVTRKHVHPCFHCGRPFTEHSNNKDWRCPDGKDCWSPYGEPGF